MVPVILIPIAATTVLAAVTLVLAIVVTIALIVLIRVTIIAAVALHRIGKGLRRVCYTHQAENGQTHHRCVSYFC